MNPFEALTVGVRFTREAHQKHHHLFQKSQDSVSSAFLDSGFIRTSIEESPSSGKERNIIIHTPTPSSVLTIGKDDFPYGRVESSNWEEDRAGGIHHPSFFPLHGENKAKDKPLPSMTYKKIKNIWQKHELQVSGTDIPPPIQHFSDLVRPPLSAPHHVVDNLFRRDHKVPTAIQVQAISTLVHKRDLLACAPTGSGKTIAFLVPMFTLLKEPNRSSGIRALIITPTMELAMQIEREAFFLARGGRWRYVQHGQTTKDKDFLVSTPGRLVTLLERKLIQLDNVEYLVFDEGDRLWDAKSDFLVIVDRILGACTKKDKVTSLFTATLSEKVEEAARSVMNSPVRLIVNGRQSANSNVEQQLLFCGNELGKIVAMRNLICEGIAAPVLIFVQSIERSQELYDEINTSGLNVRLMHAKLSTEEREDLVLQFRLGKIWILITTELLSRGIDFKNVNTVINFDIPLSGASYIHRVGRTGRAGKTGKAITFYTIEDKDRIPPIAEIMKASGSKVEDWMTELKVDKKKRRHLELTTPKRMIISTRKRVMVANKRYERDCRRAKKELIEEEMKDVAGNTSEDEGVEEGNDGDVGTVNSCSEMGGENGKTSRKKPLPAASLMKKKKRKVEMK